MSIYFGGLVSGLPVNNIISQILAIDGQPITQLQNQQTSLNNEISQSNDLSGKVTSLLNSVTTLTNANLGSSLDPFAAKTTSTTDSTKVSATADNSAAVGSFTVDVTQLATNTKATSASTVGKVTTGTDTVSSIAQGGITSGSFTVYANNTAHTINVNTTDTVQTVLDSIASAIGGTTKGSVTASGQLKLTKIPNGTTISFGASGDTSNFATQTFLTTGSQGGTTFTAQYGTSTINLNGALIGNAANLQSNTVSAGSVTIGGDSFTINSSTTLSSLMSAVNSSSKAGVTMTYDATANKVDLVSKNTGQTAITLNDNGTGTLQSLGLINGTDSLSSQTLGQNAKFDINGGSTLQSTSNTVDSTVTGLTGVTLNLAGQTTVGSPVTINVSQDNSQVTADINDFVSKFNDVMNSLGPAISSGGTFYGNSSLESLKNNILNQVFTSSTTNSTYTTLGQIGISTGAVNPNASNTDPSQNLQVDSSALSTALTGNPTAVKQLLDGNGSTNGILQNLQNVLQQAVDPVGGIFTNINQGANAEIQSINSAIGHQQDLLSSQEQQLRSQFNAMEQVVSQFKTQQTTLGLNFNSYGVNPLFSTATSGIA